MEPLSIRYLDYTITTDKSQMQVQALHRYLSAESYWARNIPQDVVQRSFDHSFCIAALNGEEQVGFARLITDYATFAYLADVYVLESHRGKGLSKKMLEVLMDQPFVKGLRRIMLATLDAHTLYEQFRFRQPAFPERFMEVSRPRIYEDNQEHS